MLDEAFDRFFTRVHGGLIGFCDCGLGQRSVVELHC